VFLSLVIPCYQERESLPMLLEALDAARDDLAAAGHDVEVAIVDDGSTDGSAELLRDATYSRTWLRVVRLSRNYGQTAALVAGFGEARGDVIVPLDADLQNDPADIPALLRRLDEGYDVVSGWRRTRHDRALTRRLPSWLGNRVISWISGVQLHDYGCTLKAYRREVIEGVQLYGEMHRFIPIYAAWRGARVTEIPVRHHPRRRGTSKYGLGRAPSVLLDLLFVRFLWSSGTKPIHAFGRFGLANLFMSGAAFALMVWLKLWGHKDFVQTPLPAVCVMFFLFGGLSILLGFLAELTIRTYHEAGHHPIYVVREIYRGGATQPAPHLKSLGSG
jgi:glycosyltransferase involved in cell wall biosynthesis